MESILSPNRKFGVSIILLIHFLSLYNDILFVHSHWFEGNLVSVHAHPYSQKIDNENHQNKDTHSDEEYELYDLIFNTPTVELEFFDFELSPFCNKSSSFFTAILFFQESNIKFLHYVRGPPDLM